MSHRTKCFCTHYLISHHDTIIIRILQKKIWRLKELKGYAQGHTQVTEQRLHLRGADPVISHSAVGPFPLQGNWKLLKAMAGSCLSLHGF